MMELSLPVEEYLKIIGELTMRLRHADLVTEELQRENAMLKQALSAKIEEVNNAPDASDGN